MDLFELFDPQDDRPDRRVAGQEPPRRGPRSFFRRWMAAIAADEDSHGNPERTRDVPGRRRDFDWD